MQRDAIKYPVVDAKPRMIDPPVVDSQLGRARWTNLAHKLAGVRRRSVRDHRDREACEEREHPQNRHGSIGQCDLSTTIADIARREAEESGAGMYYI